MSVFSKKLMLYVSYVNLLDCTDDYLDEDNNADDTGDIMSFNETASSSSSAATLSNHINGYRRKRRSTPNNLITYNAYTMEVLIAVDRKMQEYHGENMKAYILTLMSIVSNQKIAPISTGNIFDEN